MNPVDRENAKSIFADALAAPAAERDALISSRTTHNPALASHVRDMLAAYDQAGAFLSSPSLITPEIVAAAPIGGPASSPMIGPDPAEPIGPYRLGRRLGEGGFGLVYEAQQTHPVRRTVAIKIIKPGMDTARVIARFEAERQALALMDHPAIARVFDAGATAAGRPYFAMELVEGRPITAFVAEHTLDLRARLELFETVCLAVQHAHQKGIIHRDLKPSNILVRRDDAGRPVPKIIDFGIAKATGPALGEHTALTDGGTLVGTPEYMAPEQADFNAAAVDTRSDIYSLGVVLYELLTGVTPFDRAAASGSFADLQRLIREVDPPRPSTRLSASRQALPGTPGSTLLAEPANSRLLRGDLDWVVMRAIEKEPSRRYPTAADFAADIRRFLDHKPVSAGPQSAAYVARKFIRRNRVMVAAGSLALVALCAGAAAAAVGLVQAQRARVAEALRYQELLASQRQTEAALARSETVARFLKSVFSAVSPSIAQGRDTALLRDILDAGAARADAELKSDPEALAEILLSIGSTYRNAAMWDAAVPVLSRAGELAAALTPANPRLRAEVGSSLGYALRESGDVPGAIATLDEAIAAARTLNPPPASLLGASLTYRAGCESARGDNPAAMALAEQAVDAYAGADDPVGLASAKALLASLKRAGGDFPAAAALLTEVVDQLRPRTDGRIELGSALNSLAVLERQRGALDKAEALYRESLAVRRALYDRAHPDVATVLLNLGNVLVLQGRFDEAELLMRESVAMHEEIYKGDHVNQAIALDRLGMLEYNRGRNEEARAILADARAIMLKTVGPDHPFTATNSANLGSVLLDLKRPADAEAALQAAVDGFARFGRDPNSLTVAQTNLADAIADQGRPAEALVIIDQALARRRELFPNDPLAWLQTASTRGRILRELGRTDESLAQLRETLELSTDKPALSALQAARLLREWGRSLAAADRPEEAREAFIRAQSRLDPARSPRDRAVHEQLEQEISGLPPRP
jgi:serine/threonine protein kinase/tetratricopeptide (TPR) repeat protein